ncbi:stabilizer of axonemal microtubules 1-like [Anguilla anguilla]|nr:stabilizer of axonemal microtubules 1-like [Anguilla anguilla]
MVVKSMKAEEVRAANQLNEKPLGTRDNLKRATTPNQWTLSRKPGSSSKQNSRGAQVEMPKLPVARDKNVSEYQGNYKVWPALSIRKRRPMDCIRLKGDFDLLTNYAAVYKGVKGEVAKLVRPQDNVGTDQSPFKTFTEYQDTYKAWSVLPVRSKKPVEYRARGDVDFVSNYAQEYKAWKIQRRLPIIHLEQTAMPVGPFQNITSYRYDFTHRVAKQPPGSNRPNGGETQLLIKGRQLPRSISTKESRESRSTDAKTASGRGQPAQRYAARESRSF